MAMQQHGGRVKASERPPDERDPKVAPPPEDRSAANDRPAK
jgi:hypothetical protein